MKKIDLHIHTIPTNSDPTFTFSMEKLKEYVAALNLDCIAITNHNQFELEQFKQIDTELNNEVLASIEINLEMDIFF